MPGCDHTRLLLGPFEDGELEPHEMEDVALHIVECAECKGALDDYRALGVALRDIAPQPSLEGFADAIQTRLGKLQPSVAVRIRRRFGALAQSIGAGAAIGAAAAAAAVLTAMVVTPYARHVLRPVAAAPAATANAPTVSAPVMIAAAPDSLAAPPILVAASPRTPTAPQSLPSGEIANGFPPDPAALFAQAERDATQSSQAVISQLEADSPSVALWNEPQTKTTVIWVPDQP
ncbi:MAG TPA: zf-HC2 domain-containing protein [Candidatus Binataceae bacterium]|nr:zf-HC2 domain-containing protein [Candidatus Binataceae bacterium]